MVPNVVCLQKTAPNFWRKTHEDLLFGDHTKKGFHDLCGRKFVAKSHTKTLWANLGKFRQKSCTPPKICLPPTPMHDRTVARAQKQRLRTC